jgi:peptidyl-prolyl cis-trans isomerase D
MATLEKLRNRAGTLVAVVIGLALLAFILGDLLGSGGSLFNRSQFEIAEISGKSIPYQHYQERIDRIVELNKAISGQSAIDEQTSERISEEVWNEIVREHVLGNSYDNHGIVVTPEELFDMVQGRNLHPIIKEQFGNRQTGEVDRTMIIQFLKNMENDPSGLQKTFWLYIENLIQNDRIYNKYINLIKKGMFVTNLHANRSLVDRNKKVDFSYVLKRYTSINDSLITVTEKEISNYHKQNKHEFEQQASRDVEYVVFPIRPSQDDYSIAEEWINNVKGDFAQANDPIQFTNLNSDTPFNNRYLKPSELANEELNQWAAKATVGDVYGPIFENDSYQLARIVDIAQIADSVKARHILIGVSGQSKVQFDMAKAKADSLYNVIKKGGNFARLANEYSDDPGSANQGGDLGWFPEGVMVQPFNDACFKGKKGDIVLVETQFGFHIINLLDVSNTSKKIQVAILGRTVIPSTRSYQKIYQEASEFAGLNNTFEKFNQAVQDKKLSKRVASNLRESDRRVAGLENPREMVRWAYSANELAVSPVFEFGDNFVVATLRSAKEEGIAPLEQVKEDIKSKIIIEKKAAMLKEDFSNVMNQYDNINQIGRDLSVLITEASRISFSSFSLPTVGFEPAVIATAVSTPEGVIAGPVKGNTGVYALVVNAVNIEEGDKSAERRRLMNSFQSRAGFEAYEAMKKSAEIVDKRSMFF